MGSLDASPIRPGAAPTLDTGAIRFSTFAATQPIWVRMTDVLIRWLRYHFGDASRIEYPDLVDRVYVDGDSSKIVITSLAEWKPNSSDHRPAILIDRLDQETDMANRPIGPQYQGIRTGYFTDFMRGQHVVHCLGGREGEAEYLAAEVWRDLKRFAPKAREYLCLYRFLPERIMKRRQLDEHKETYAVSIPCSYYYDESWKLTNLSESEITGIFTTVN
jgi:hypothetical protein